MEAYIIFNIINCSNNHLLFRMYIGKQSKIGS